MNDRDSTIQKIINSFTEGAGVMALRTLLAIAIVTGAYGFYAYQQFRGLTDSVGMENAQLARHVANSKRFETRCIRAFDAELINKHSTVPLSNTMPDVRNPPLFPALVSAGFKLMNPSFASAQSGAAFTPESRVIVPLGILLCVLTGLLIFLTAQRLFSAEVGWLAASLFMVSDAVFNLSLSGTGIPLTLCLTMAATLTAIQTIDSKQTHPERLSWLLPFTLSALLAGAAGLADYRAILFSFILAGFLSTAFDRGRSGMAMLYIAFSLAVMAPWGLRNMALTGNPFGAAPFTIFHNTFLYPGATLDSTLNATFDNTLVMSALRDKLLSQITSVLDVEIKILGSGLTVCFFFASFLHVFEDRKANAMRWTTLVAAVGLMLLHALGASNHNHALMLLLPFVTLFGAAFIVALLQRIVIEDEWKTIIMGGLVVLATLPAILKMTVLPPAHPFPPHFPPFISYTAELLDEDEWVCTDIPAAYAWYGNRTAVLRPTSVKAFEELHTQWHPFAGLYLSPVTSDQPWLSKLAAGPEKSWGNLLNQHIPESFPLKHAIALPPDSAAQVFLTDRVRWVEATEEEKTIDHRP